jgi:hypothetical protein
MKNHYFIVWTFAISFCFSTFLVSAQTKFNFDRNSRQLAEKWEVIDITFKVRRKPSGNPFDVAFGATFRGPGNISMKVPGFYNGNNEWVVRFSANKEGNWVYETFSSHQELSGLLGTVEAKSNTNKDRHGAVVVNPVSPQYFIYEDGTPYFSLAFELDWLFALDYKNKNDIPRTRQIIKDVKGNGFNQVVMNVFAYDVKWKTDDKVPAEYEFRRPDIFPFKGTNDQPDFSELNVDFFKHFDRVIDHLDKEGVVAHLMIYVWNKKVNWPEMYSKADNMFYDYVISRYQAFTNIMWDVSKEALDHGRCDIPYINERISRIRQNDNFKRLVTVHDYEYCSREPQRIDYISVQNWRANIYDQMLMTRQAHHKMPVMNIEHGGYETGPYLSFYGNYISPEICVIRNYECVFAGVYSSYYWQNTSWNIVVWDALKEGQPFAKPRYDYYKHMQSFFTKYNFNNLFPAPAKLTTNANEGMDNLSNNGFALTNGKDLFMFLVPSYVDLINTIIPKPASGKMNVTWFNPFTGEYKEEGSTPWSVWKESVSPWKNTYSILIVDIN